MRTICLLLALVCLASCQKIETGKTLSKKQIEYIKSLGLLDDNETIIKFYSEFTKKKAGNFYTDKRMAEYWIDESNSSKDHRNSAWYSEIVAIDTNYMHGALTYAPYMWVTKKDGTHFKVCVEGSHKAVKAFFEDAIKIWKSKRKNL
jgi:hypothetical protein